MTLFSMTRGRMRARSASVNIAALVYQLSHASARFPFPAGATVVLLAIFTLSAVLLLVVVRSLDDFLLGALSVLATFFGAYLQGGTPPGLTAFVVTLLTLFLLAAASAR